MNGRGSKNSSHKLLCKCDNNLAPKSRTNKRPRDPTIPCREPGAQVCRYEEKVITNNKIECKCDTTNLNKRKKIDCKCEEGCLKKRTQKFYRQPAIPESWAPKRKFVKPTIRMASATEYKDNYTPKKIVKTPPIKGKDSMVLSKTPMNTISTYQADYTLPGTMHWETVETCGDPTQFNCYCEEEKPQLVKNNKDASWVYEERLKQEKAQEKAQAALSSAASFNKKDKAIADDDCPEVSCCPCG